MKSYDYIELAKTKNDVKSDYKISKLLGVSSQYVSSIKTQKGTYLTEQVVPAVSKLSGVTEEIILIDIAGEKAKTPHTRKIWGKIKEHLENVERTRAKNV